MKISLNAIKWHGYDDLFKLPVNQLADKIGAQLGALEEAPLNLGERYEGILVVSIVSCEDHPQADRLHVCLIDDGGVAQNVPRNEAGHVQVVCGAPNVRAGMTVAWLPPGSTVPSSVPKEPFVLEARELRGVVSNGMLASASELAISDDHDGILEITAQAVGEELVKPGTLFKRLYGLDDYILDIENKMFTHRPDCFGLLGVGREIAGIQGLPFTSPSWYRSDAAITTTNETLPLTVTNEIPELVQRFMAVSISGITIKPSPIWLQSLLTRVGIRPINNIVDLTNYYMVLTGQPLHAYDYDKVKALDGGEGATLVVRNPRASERLKLLNGKEINPRQEAILIASDSQLIALGGVMGGASTEVDNNTTNIILECATFDMYSIRRSSMAHGIFSDAVTRNNKGQSPLQNSAVLTKVAEDVIDLAGGAIASHVIDDNHLSEAAMARNSLYTPVKVPVSFINERLGLDLSAQTIKQLLHNVEFRIEIADDMLTVIAPFWRTDIELREDVVEEVGRLYGFDKLPLVLPRRDLTPAVIDPLLQLKDRLRSKLVAAGANEVLTYSFVHRDLLDKVRQDESQAFQLSNALSPELQYYRLSLSASLLDKVHANVKAGYEQFALFELGKVHSVSELDSEGLPIEFDRLALVFTASDKIAANYSGAAYYQARGYLLQALHATGEPLSGLRFEPLATADLSQHPLTEQLARSFEPQRAAVLYKGDEPVGAVGEYISSVRRLLKLPAYTAGFELSLSKLDGVIEPSYVALPRFPSVSQDISLKVPTAVSYQQLYDFVWSELAKVQPEQTLPELGPVDIYQRPDDVAHKQITLRFTITSYERTLTDKEVAALLEPVAAAAAQQLGAERL